MQTIYVVERDDAGIDGSVLAGVYDDLALAITVADLIKADYGDEVRVIETVMNPTYETLTGIYEATSVYQTGDNYAAL